MTETTNDPAAAPLQFERAEFDGPVAAASCTACATVIQGSYWSLAGQTLCGRCKQGVEAAFAPGPVLLEFPKALAFGFGAGLAGSVLWYLVAHFLDMHLGLIAILIGWLVGTGVSKAIGGRGGRGYQVLAVLLTYACICFAFAPDVAAEMAKPRDDGTILPGWFVWPFAAVVSLALPFLGGMGPITLLIGGFGIWEAWRRNRKVVVTFEGPFLLAPSPSVAAAANVAPPTSSSPPGSGEPLL